jgi:hypothetical protein
MLKRCVISIPSKIKVYKFAPAYIYIKKKNSWVAPHIRQRANVYKNIEVKIGTYLHCSVLVMGYIYRS